MRYDTAIEQFVPASLPPGVFAAGRVNGIYALDEKLRDGERAGLEAVQSARALHRTAPVGATEGRAGPAIPIRASRIRGKELRRLR